MENIDHLLNKYFDGETTEKEERALKDFFMLGEVPKEYKKYQDYFEGIPSQNDFLSDDFDEKIRNMIAGEEAKPEKKQSSVFHNYWRYAVAASIVLVMGIVFLGQDKPNFENDTYKDPEVAMEETKKALYIISSTMNEGMKSMNTLSEINKATKKITTTITEGE